MTSRVLVTLHKATGDIKTYAIPDGLALPEDHRSGPNCGVTAVAVIAGVPFDLAWTTIAKLNPKRTSRWRGATWWYEQRAALRHLGATVHELDHKGMTLARFVELHTVKGQTYLVNVTNHAVVVRDGLVLDQGGIMPIAIHGARRWRVKHAARCIAPPNGPPNHD